MDGSRAEEAMMQLDPQDRRSEEDVIMDHYKILKTLGTGNFAQVKLAIHHLTEVPVALKMLEKGKTNSTLIENEREIMKILEHPNIIKLFHVMETTEHIYLVLEYASGGDLASRILEVGYMPEVEVQHVFTQLVCAVKYCHENDIAHRDIKPENILMDANKNVKLCDFGLAINVSTEPESTVFCGTLPYCAPELFSSQCYDPRALDIWSMGVVLYIMVTKHYPFKGKTYEEMQVEMQKPHCYIPPKLSGHIARLIIKLFTTDPRQRPKIHNLTEYPWLKGSKVSKPTLSLKTLPDKPNPSIMAAMWGMGYSPKDIRDSLCKKNFGSIMATYLLLKHESPCVDNTNHNGKLMQPNIGMAPTDPPTCHYFLKSIGSEPDNSTSTLPEKYQSHGEEKFIKNKDRKNHTVPAIHCCQQKSQPHSISLQCCSLQHDHEQLLSSSSSKGLSCGLVEHVHEYHLYSSLQKRSRASKGLSCGPLQHDHEQLLSSSSFKDLSCGLVEHVHEYHLCSSLQKRSRASKGLSCGPLQYGHEHLLSSRASKGLSCGPVLHGHEYHLSSSLQKSDIVPKSMSCGPVLHGHEYYLCSSLQKRDIVPKCMSCGPVLHGHEYHLCSSLQKRDVVPKSMSCGPVLHVHEYHLCSSLQKRDIVPKSMSCGPVLHGHEYHLCSSLQKRDIVPKSMSCGPVLHVHEYHLCNSLQKRDIVPKSMPCGPVQHNQDLLSITLQKRSRAFKSLSCGPMQPNHDEQLLRRSLQKRSRASKSVFCGPVQHDLEQHLDILPENHITQMEAQSENPSKSSSFLQHTPSSRSSEEGLENVTTTDAHQDKSLPPHETSDPNLTSAQPQRVTIASPRRWGGWKQMKRRLVKGLRRLCCCLSAERRSCTFQRRVAPQEGADNRVA